MAKTGVVIGILAAAALALAGCGNKGGGGGGGGDHTVTSLALTAASASNGAAKCAQSSDGCDCPKGASAKLTLVAKDASGKAVSVDLSDADWTVSDETAVGFVDNGDGTATVSGKRDWFDVGDAEGEATVVANFGGHSASIPVRVIIDASGDWRAATDVGLNIDLALTQSGRTVTDAKTGYGGSVQDDQLSLQVSVAQAEASFVSRDEVQGTFTGPNGLHGTLTVSRK